MPDPAQSVFREKSRIRQLLQAIILPRIRDSTSAKSTNLDKILILDTVNTLRAGLVPDRFGLRPAFSRVLTRIPPLDFARDSAISSTARGFSRPSRSPALDTAVGAE